MSGRKPAWWLLYLFVPVLIGLLIVDHELVLSLLGHQLVQLGILFAFIGLVVVWIRSNSAALVRKEKPNALSLIITVDDPCAQDRRKSGERKSELKKAA